MSFHFKKQGIEDILPERTSTSPEDLFCYGFDASAREGLPSALIKPATTEEVVRLASFAFENSVPIVPRGAGTGMTGGSVPLRDTVVLSMEGMNRVLEIDAQNMVAVVEPGVMNAHLQEKLEERGLFYPPDPASMKFCTLGGNVAENAGGPRAIKYGVTKDYVLGLEVVLPDGRVLSTGGKTCKGVVGYDLTRLMVGSEGTLGIITKIILRVLPLPEEVMTILSTFSRLEDAARAVSRISSSSIIPRTLEIMDQVSIRAVEDYRPYGLPVNAQALLLIEVDGSRPSVARDGERVASLCSECHGIVSVAEDIFSKQRIWEARRAISPALYHLKPAKINEDIVVPRGQVPAMFAALRDIAEKNNLLIASFGHAGDGNIHVNVMTGRDNPKEYSRAERSVREIFEATLKLGGTISGEHGVGLTKMQYIKMEISDVSLEMMRGIKSVFDPKGILNPGKIFPGPD